MKVIGYANIAGHDAGEYGVEAQERAIALQAKANGHELVASFRDEGGFREDEMDGRLGLAAALDALRKGPARGLVLARLECLARDPIVQEQVIAEVWGMGAFVFSATASEESVLGPAPPPARKLIREVLASVTGHERAMRSLRARLRRGPSRVPPERERSGLARIEELARQGATATEITWLLRVEGFAPPGGLLRLRRGFTNSFPA